MIEADPFLSPSLDPSLFPALGRLLLAPFHGRACRQRWAICSCTGWHVGVVCPRLWTLKLTCCWLWGWSEISLLPLHLPFYCRKGRKGIPLADTTLKIRNPYWVSTSWKCLYALLTQIKTQNILYASIWMPIFHHAKVDFTCHCAIKCQNQFIKQCKYVLHSQHCHKEHYSGDQVIYERRFLLNQLNCCHV